MRAADACLSSTFASKDICKRLVNGHFLSYMKSLTTPTGLKVTQAKLWSCLLTVLATTLWSHSFAKESVLPPLEFELSDTNDDVTIGRVFVREFRFKGNSVFSNEELQTVIGEEYTHRELTMEDIEEARDALTSFYIENGFINSGAVLPNQWVKDGVITFVIVEGILSEIHIEGNKSLRTDYIRNRLRGGAGPPLNINDLRASIQLLKQNPNVRRINAELKPGIRPGESFIVAKITENNPYRLEVSFANNRSPSIGAEQIELTIAHQSLTQNSDALQIRYGLIQNGFEDTKLSNLDNISGSYNVPLNANDTTLQIHFARSDSTIVEESIETLDITSDSIQYGLSLIHPFYRSNNHEFTLTLRAERRESETFLDGTPFSFSPGAEEGKTKITSLRFISEWVWRTQKQVLAFRSAFSFGVDVDATDDGSDRDGKYFSWLGQLQYVRRLGNSYSRVIFRLSGQRTNDPLLSLEQFVIGGVNTVRGYRENQLVRDMGVVSSLELRSPIYQNKRGERILQLAPFIDFGGGWNHDDSPTPHTIASIGIGVLFNPNRYCRLQCYWGYAFRDFDTPEDNLQDSGIHFALNIKTF